MIRIRFVTTDDAVSSAIRGAQLGFVYTHAEVVVEGGYLGARARGGVKVRPVGYDAGPGMLERFLELPVTCDQEAAVLGFLRGQIGKPYDFAAIADLAFALLHHPDRVREPGAWREPSAWFCSELIAAALMHAGVPLGDLIADARHVTPAVLAYVLDAVIAFSSTAPVAA